MAESKFENHPKDVAWCAGCGNFGILTIMKQTLEELNLKPEQVVMVSGIGQAAKIPHYLKAHVYNGLHGRALPPATAIKASNPELTVICESGDGDIYGEGGNHFIHTLRRNPNVTCLVHDNMVYGLTKGQASPTSQKGFVTPVQIDGVFEQPFNPLAVAIALDASFVARASVADAAQTKEIIKKAILHSGFAIVDIFQPCVSFNKVNTYQWFKEHTYYLEENFDPTNREAAFKRSIETERFPLGVFYINPNKDSFEKKLSGYKNSALPLFKRTPDYAKLSALIASKK